ncbi:hypothetical protein [Risungbinella massiliensis]|uniref:hypothetical protein n=1 Tax=Risungbinella massiliensis TaxID=1329796 RepID=UPI0012B62CF5|nr:hypothetical protein [Risungbinella massiliensis]
MFLVWYDELSEWEFPDLNLPEIPFHPFTNTEDFTVLGVFLIVVLCIVISQLPKS